MRASVSAEVTSSRRTPGREQRWHSEFFGSAPCAGCLVVDIHTVDRLDRKADQYHGAAVASRAGEMTSEVGGPGFRGP